MKKAFYGLSTCLFVAGIFGYFAYDHAQPKAASPTLAFDVAALLELEAFGDITAAQHFDQDLSLVFYFSELSCRTCTHQELQTVADWYSRYQDKMNFYLVVQGQEPSYLHNLRRLGRVHYPLLLEAQRGQLGLPTTTIALFRKSTQHILAQYHPQPDQSHIADKALFHKRLQEELGGRKSSRARDKAT